MTIAAYLRTSTRLQMDANGAAGQREAIRRWLVAQGIDPATVTEYDDEGKSGRNTRRPGFQAMMQGVRAGQVRTVVTYSLTRLGRSTRDLLAIVEEMQAKKVRIVFVKEAIDLGTPIGRFFLTVLAGLAELEREIIGERTSSGIQAQLQAGRSWGAGRRRWTPESPIGQRYDWPALLAEFEASGLRVGEFARAKGVPRVSMSRGLAQARKP